MKKISLATLMLFLLLPSYTIGQRRTSSSSNSGRDRSSSESATRTRPMETSRGYRGIPQSSPSERIPSSAGGGTSPYFGSYYNYGYYATYYSICQNFLYSLARQYAFLNPDLYLWRYSQMDSPLDRDVLLLALRDSYQTSDQLLRQVDALSGLLDQYEAGTIGQKTFSDSVETSVDRIRKLAKNIRKDESLRFLDQRRDVSSKSPDAVESIQELRSLISQLRLAAFHIQQGLENYYVNDYTRVIDLQHLQSASFKSMSEKVDQLAKVIEKSANKI